MTPRTALSEGSDYLVIGRPILQAKDRAAALREINNDISLQLGNEN
jgi:orotidine-5'-phosphate decarboxylase